MSAENKLPLKSISLITAIKLLAACVGLLQTIALASLFGATRTIEVFFAALTFQQLLAALTSSGQIGDLFTPIYHDIKVSHGSREAWAAFSAMTNVMLLFASIVAVGAALLARPISAALVPGFATEDLELTQKVFLSVAPLIVVMIGNSMLSNLLRAEHRYGLTESLQLAGRVANLVILLGLAPLVGVWALIVGMWVSAIILAIGQIWDMYRNGGEYKFVLSTSAFQPRTVLCKIPLSLTHVFAAQFFTFALTAGLSLLPEGSYAAFSYAQRLRAKFQGLVLQPVGIVFFNHFSESLSQGATKVRSFAEHALGLTLAVTAFSLAPIVASGDLLLAGLWGGPDFPPERIAQTHYVLCALTALLAINAQYLIARRTNLALKIVGPQFAASSSVITCTGFACYWLIPAYGLPGVVALQIATAAGTALTSLGVLAHYRRELLCLLPLKQTMQWIVTVAITICVVWTGRHFIGPVADVPAATQLVAGGLWAIASVLITCAVAHCLGIREFHDLSEKVLARSRRLLAQGAKA
ncbi:MAG: lipid II flippase MurJ [Planctomycetota bacterium]